MPCDFVLLFKVAIHQIMKKVAARTRAKLNSLGPRVSSANAQLSVHHSILVNTKQVPSEHSGGVSPKHGPLHHALCGPFLLSN